MKLEADTTRLYLRHAFAGMERVLDRLDDDTVNLRPPCWGTNSVAGLVVHCCELAPSWLEMPGLGRNSERDRDTEFATEASIVELRERIAAAVATACDLAQEFHAGPTVPDHPLREFMPGDDRSDAALVLHVLEELFQHLGHMEVTADAVARTTTA